MAPKSELIVFAKLPQPGQVKTRLGRVIGMREATEVYSELAHRTFRVAGEALASGLGVCVYYDPASAGEEVRLWVGRQFAFYPQAGNSLGGRIRSAFDETFARGTSTAVVVGTDTVGLDLGILQEAFSILSSKDVVLGPARDGGYYLLGMNAPTKDVFRGIRWSSPEVYTQTVDHVRRLALSHGILPQLVDIDTVESYQQFLADEGLAP